MSGVPTWVIRSVLVKEVERLGDSLSELLVAFREVREVIPVQSGRPTAVNRPSIAVSLYRVRRVFGSSSTIESAPERIKRGARTSRLTQRGITSVILLLGLLGGIHRVSRCVVSVFG